MEQFPQIVIARPLPQTAKEEAIPQFRIVLQQADRRGQSKVMPEAVKQTHAIAVDRAEKSLLKSALNLG